MFQEEYESYTPYQPLPQRSSSAPAGILDDHPVKQDWPEQDAMQPPRHPSGPLPEPTPPQKPRKRPGRTAAALVLSLVLALIFGVGLFSGWQFAHTNSSSTPAQATATSSASPSSQNTVQTQQEAAIANIEPAIVELKVTTAQGEQIGSGVIINSSGDIVTNNHVISGAQTIQAVTYNGTTLQAQLVGSNAAEDLAVVRITPFAHMVVAPIGNSSKLAVGQEVLAIGNPLGITETATNGIISALNRSVTESTGATITNAIQTDAPINPGNSGGALINLQGQLIGIPTLTAVNAQSNTAANGIGFAIPSNLVKTVVSQIVK